MAILVGLPAAGVIAAAAPFTAGWQAQSYPKVRGIVSAAVSKERAHSGQSSLSAHVMLSGAVAVRRQGEVFVDMRFHPPGDLNAPIDLSGKTLSAWVYPPAGLQGPAHNPNGVRLFVKDSAWRSEYGAWTHLTPGKWMRLTLVPSVQAPPTGYRDPNFSPRKIIVIGVSVATGKGSTARFDGEMQIDDVTVAPGASYTFEAP